LFSVTVSQINMQLFAENSNITTDQPRK